MATAVLVIDLQENTIGDKLSKRYRPGLIDDINARLAISVQADELVVYIKNLKSLRSGKVLSPLVEGLDVVSDHILTKDRTSAFANPELLTLLKNHGVEHVELVGVDGNQCIAITAVNAINLGLAVTLSPLLVGVANAERFEQTKARLQKAGVLVI
ncbi:MAG: isochorismatase family protein [Coriobacteriales bacterium]|jgi:nicotinamidase-related amidase|nr:isochorismatase family protein [Coriobacteriales bacterium]